MAAISMPIELEEYRPCYLPAAALPDEVGEALWRSSYSKQVVVEFPTPATNGQWRLTAQGWVGYIPFAPGYTFALRPKVALGNLFGMLEYAYRVDIHIGQDLVGCASLDEFYQRLAHILARRVLDRARRGFYRAYIADEGRLPYVRGQLDAQRMMRTPHEPRPYCCYQEHTGDIAENQILAWALHCVARSGLCRDESLRAVRGAYRALLGVASLTPHHARACCGRVYNRLNEDYEPLHALCRFFLEHTGPSHSSGDRDMLPFLIDMARLYEMFVAEWLRTHLPEAWRLKAQEHVAFGDTQAFEFKIDLVLAERATDRARIVLDTKYKSPDKPSASDIQEIVSYAVAKDCAEAVLIYPTALVQPLNAYVGGIHVRSLTFTLEGDLEAAGRAFVESLRLS